MQERRGFPSTFLLLLLLTGCVLPSSCRESIYVPSKWQVTMMQVTGFVAYCLYMKLHGNNLSWSATPVLRAVFYVVLFESLFVVAELIVIPDRILQAGLQGTFDAPGGLALVSCLFGTIAAWLLFRQSILQGKADRRKAWFVMLSCAAMVLLSQSRTGLLAAVFVALSILLSHWSVSSIKKSVVASTCVCVICAYMVIHKQASTQGRFFILQRTCELMEQRPLLGYGFGGFQRAYMRSQAKYFQEHPHSNEAVLADDIRHPLNDFALVGVNHGIVGILLLLSVFSLPCIVHTSSLHKYLVAVAFIFSLFSHPFAEPITWGAIGFVLLTMEPVKKNIGRLLSNIGHRFIFSIHVSLKMVIVLCLLMEFFFAYTLYIDVLLYSADRSAHRHAHTNAVKKYRALEHSCLLQGNATYWYNYAYELYQHREFDEAYAKALKCRSVWDGYNLELLMGDIALHRRNSQATALGHYRLASYMCPVRFAPLEGMYRAYLSMGDTVQANRVAREVHRKKVKVPSAAIEQMKKRIKVL